MDNILGTSLEGRYLIEELIGSGGMANVYKAFDTMESRPVAVKMLKAEYAGDEDHQRRFRNESKAICALNHKNIVKIYDVVLNVPIPFIVMEYVNGITLRDYLDKKGRLEPKLAVALIMQLLAAVANVNDNGIVHRDIKPNNIVLRSDGTLKLMDFGIARFAMSQSRTITDRAIGSVHYISPEQAKGEGVTDNRADIYSVGVILFELITGALPFEADTAISVAIKHIESEPKTPRSINPAIPLGLEQITLRAMAKDPKDRYQSAADMLQDLKTFSLDPTVTFGHYAKAHAKQARSSAQNAPQTAKTSGKKKTAKKTRGKASFVAVLFGITCAFLIITAAFILYMFERYRPFEPVPEVTVPNLLGVNYDQAMSASGYKFVFELEGQEYNDQFGKGEIFDQYPSAGRTVKKGSIIKVKVSNGTQTMVLPNFINQEATAVYAKLKELGLNYTVAEVTSDSVKEGYVTRTEPGSNDVVTSSTTIVVYVSKGSGKQLVLVPDVVGYNLEKAKEMITAGGLKAVVNYITDYDLPAGTVVSQNPDNPTRISVGSTVSLTVSTDADSSKRVTIMFIPPDGEEEMLITAMVDGSQFFSEWVDPNAHRVVALTVEGTKGTSTVDIYYNGVLYKSALVNYDEGNGVYEWITSAETAKTVSIMFMPPDDDSEVLLTANIDGIRFYSETVIPSQHRILTVSATRTGGTAVVEIYYNGELFKSADVDFDTQSFKWIADNASEFPKQ